MANIFLNLPAPSANGAGAWVPTATMGAEKDIVVGGTMVGTINVEFTNEAVAANGITIASTKKNRGKLPVRVAAMWMRAVVVGYQSGTPEVDVGANDDGCVRLGLPVTPGDGAGAAQDSSLLPLTKTVTVAGPFKGTVIIEYSEDGGTTWAPWVIFTQPGSATLRLVCNRMRVTRAGTPIAGAGTPIVNVGACEDAFTPGFGNPQIVRYVAIGGESDFMVNFAAPRPNDLYDVFPGEQGGAAIVGLDMPDTVGGDRTAAGFRVVTTGALTAGDVLSFLAADR